MLVERASVDDRCSAAGAQYDAGNGRLALPCRLVAGPRGQIYRRAGDRLGQRSAVKILLRFRLLVLLQSVGIDRLLGGKWVHPIGHDVYFKMRARHAWLDTGRGLLVLELLPLCLSYDLGSDLLSDSLDHGLLDDSLRYGLLDKLLRDSLDDGLLDSLDDDLLSHDLLDGWGLGDLLGGLASRLRGLGGRLYGLGDRLGGLGLVLWLLSRLVSHQASISIGCGFWATCGWSGPAYTFSLVICLRASRLRGIMPLTASLMISSGRRSIISSNVRERRPPG